MAFKDITGQKYGRLYVIKRVENDRYGNTRWLCRCDCGNEVVVLGYSLRTGGTKSCGCFHVDAVKKHGMEGTRLYYIWRGILKRCNNKADKNYGGRGIRVCDSWAAGFESFLDWATSNGYRDDLTIDRIDVNGNYEPSNCRWVTIKEQMNNRRSNKTISFNGKTLTLTQWAEEVGVHPATLDSRLKAGWTVDKALLTPARHKRKAPK